MRDQRAYILLIGFGMLGAIYAGCGPSSGTGSGGSGGAGATTASSSSKSSSSKSSVSAVTSTSSGMPAGALGKGCAADADCGGLTCVLPSDTNPAFGGGPAGGYCTKNCAKDSDCPAGAAACATDANGMNGVCVLGCTLGPQLMFINDDLDPAKCFGRDDVRCQALDMVTNACLPTCGSDSQCPAGRVCDPRVRVCVDKATMGKPTGAKCNTMAMPPECAGTCVSFGGGNTACSNACVLGAIAQDILKSPNCGGITTGICAYSIMGNGAGDYGFCAPACTAHDQCQNPTFWCQGVGGLTGMGISNGFCFGVGKCPNGQAQCMSGTCTMTPSGPYCLDAQFPLTSPDGGASSSSASSSSSSGSSSSSAASSSSSGGGGAGGGPADAGPG